MPNAYSHSVLKACKTATTVISEKSPTMRHSTAERLHKQGSIAMTSMVLYLNNYCLEQDEAGRNDTPYTGISLGLPIRSKTIREILPSCQQTLP
jgi:hypothetical protein